MRSKIQFTQPEFDTHYIAPERLGERRVSILQTAYGILAREGYQGFTMRQIANEAGMHLKTLQHYYSTKKDLLIGMLRYSVLKKYKEFWAVLVRKQTENPRDIFRLVIKYLLDDIRDPTTSRLYPELWALSNHDSDAAVAVGYLYSLYRKNMSELIRVINPTLSEQKNTQRTVTVIAMIEGMLLFMDNDTPLELGDIDEEIISAAMQIVFMP